MYTKLPIVLVTSAVLLFAAVSSAYPVFAQFDITTEQSPQDQQAVITVKLATNNTVVIPPNGTIIEIPGNVTVIDNDTIVITPENETVTEIPDSNVTVITPAPPEPCQCPAANATEQPSALEPVVVQPAPGQQVITRNGTQLVTNESQTEPIPIPEPAPPSENQTGNETGPTLPVEPEPAPPAAGNQTGGGGDNQTGTGGNDTSLSPAAFAQRVPWPSLSNIVAS